MLGLPRGAEWIVILIIVLLLFGPGRIGKIGGELGKGIKSFRDGLSNTDEDNKDKETKTETNTDSNGNIEPK
jgi:sec-independent protein translocase protein TatA